MFRHKELKELRDVAEEDPLEVEASKYALNYIKLDGNIACMVNGAGLAMATMDIIQYAGGSPANFLDVGGGANQQQIEHAFEILLSDKNVQAVFINIFGGILRVDTLAQGVVEAAKKTNVKVPVVLRLEGTNVEQGREILKQSGLNFIIGETMQDAAQKVVSAAKEARKQFVDKSTLASLCRASLVRKGLSTRRAAPNMAQGCRRCDSGGGTSTLVGLFSTPSRRQLSKQAECDCNFCAAAIRCDAILVRTKRAFR